MQAARPTPFERRCRFLEAIQQPTTVIRPSSGWQAINLRELWQFRDLLLTLAMRDVKLRYKQTALGPIWVVLGPLLSAGIFSFIFGKVAKLPSDGVPYFLFSYAGLLGWNSFSMTFGKASGSLVGNAHLVSKVYFPRLILPLSGLFTTGLDVSVALAMLAMMLLINHVVLGPGLLLLPVWLLLIQMLAMGAGLFAGALMVRYRDVGTIQGILLQFLMYVVPVAYSVSAVPVNLRAIYFLNPLASLLEAFRWSLLNRGTVHAGYLVYSAVCAVLVLAAGALFFRRTERTFADVI